MRAKLPATHAPYVHVYEVGATVIANSSAMQTQGSVPHLRRWNSRQADVDRLCLHVKAMLSHASMRTASAQEFIAPGSAVSADHVNFSA